MSHLENFSIYSKPLVTGDVITNEQVFLDSKGSFKKLVTSIFDMYDKPQTEEQKFGGQFIWINQYIKKMPVDIRYSISVGTYFFENGAITAEWADFNWTLGTLSVATITSGTGKYLGAQGFVQIDILERTFDTCLNISRWTGVITFIFTN